MKKFFKLLIICLPLLLCSKEEATYKNQVLRINFLEGAPKYVHPHLSLDVTGMILCKALFEGLTRINLKGKVELAIAQKIEISKCKTKYTFHLRKSFWSNGNKLTAHHFVNAWKAAILPNTKCGRFSHFFIIKNAKKVYEGKLPVEKVGIFAPNENKIIIHLEHPAPYFLQQLADPLFSPILNDNGVSLDEYNGPFLIKGFNPSDKINLTKNHKYWDQKNVKLNDIDISVIQDAITAYKLYQQNKLDVIGSPLSDLPNDVIDTLSNLKKSTACSAYWVYFNLNNPKFQTKEIREALNLAIDRDYISKYILPNAKPNSTVLPTSLTNIKQKNFAYSTQELQNLLNQGLSKTCYNLENFKIRVSYSTAERHAKLAKYLKYQWEKIFK